MKYVVSERALETIERECRRSPDTETGGILVGFKDKRRVTVTHATGPGPVSDLSVSRFIKDTPYLQSVLNLLFQYFQVNYLGVWHKHPGAMPFPSSGDVASAMDEVSDVNMGLDELLTPIGVMTSGRVEVHPYAIKDNGYRKIEWEARAHDKLPSSRPLATQWYATTQGQRRLTWEMERFEEAGVEAEVRKGDDGTYRFHAPLVPGSPRRLVMLCYNDYPVSPPEVVLYDERTEGYEPVASRVVDSWHLDRYLYDIFEEWRGG
ncbi:MAG: Mov34/MPN/PAD-1 family protein [SAR202 cluster bacterium]|jgi:integrative and conjugative element protein (TIGR02256 family)|nr:Mov34/MPN/PAD-1 family protein [SAR202 cluster bacterium]